MPGLTGIGIGSLKRRVALGHLPVSLDPVLLDFLSGESGRSISVWGYLDRCHFTRKCLIVVLRKFLGRDR